MKRKLATVGLALLLPFTMAFAFSGCDIEDSAINASSNDITQPVPGDILKNMPTGCTNVKLYAVKISPKKVVTIFPVKANNPNNINLPIGSGSDPAPGGIIKTVKWDKELNGGIAIRALKLKGTVYQSTLIAFSGWIGENDNNSPVAANEVAITNGYTANLTWTYLDYATWNGVAFPSTGATLYFWVGYDITYNALPLTTQYSGRQLLSDTDTTTYNSYEGTYVELIKVGTAFKTTTARSLNVTFNHYLYNNANYSYMWVDFDFRIDEVSMKTVRVFEGNSTCSVYLPYVAQGNHELRVFARTVLQSGPPTDVMFYPEIGVANTAYQGWGSLKIE